MKKLIFTSVCVMALAVVSCQKDDFISEENEVDAAQSISMTDEGYFHFNNQLTFEDYLKSFSEEGVVPATRSNTFASIPGFTSINKLKGIISQRNNTRAELNEDDEKELKMNIG